MRPSRSGGYVPLTPPAVVITPIMTEASDNQTAWDWSGPDPLFWIVYEDDGSGPYNLDEQPGDQRIGAGVTIDGGSNWVQGFSGVGHPSTPQSPPVVSPYFA